MRIGYCGNFIPKYSTEQDRAWSFRKLGHEVVEFQENTTTFDNLLDAMNTIDLLLYSHTHDPSYVINGLERVLALYKANKIPTASVHLDRYAWLARESDIQNEASWRCEYIFMADGSPEAVDLYEKHELNWYWLKPGVIERDCYIAKPDHTRFPHEIVFTGSKGYHPEYPFRRELVEFLHRTYGSRFAHYGNDGLEVLRGKDLNTMYASAKIVVGDSCFGGRPRYVSDRYYEVRGRGGFLLHPHVEGMDTNGVAHYTKGNLLSLQTAIDIWLEKDEEREKMRVEGHEWVKDHETYTHRSQEMLDIIFGERKDG